jgi:hypothetical protein
MPYKRVARKTSRKGVRRVSRKIGVSYNPNKHCRDTNLQLYKNPFALGFSTPKIPDGKGTSSVGVRQQCVFEQIPAIGSNTMDIILYPGLYNGLMVYNAAVSGFNYGYKQYETFNVNLLKGFGDDAVFRFASGLRKWRIVSQALKLRLLNSSDDNEGWFESVRFNLSPDGSSFGQVATNYLGLALGTTPFNRKPFITDGEGGQSLAIPMPWVISEMTTASLMSHPSYCTGRLRDVHQMAFQLKPSNGSHDFIEVDTSYTVNKNSTGVGTIYHTSTNAEGVTTYSDFHWTGRGETDDYSQILLRDRVTEGDPLTSKVNYDVDELIRAQVDNSFDCILIRIHGNHSGNQGATRLLMSWIANQELVFDPTSPHSKYQTRTYNHKNKVDAARSRLTQGVQSAQRGTGLFT